MADDRCLNCNATIREINYALGKTWMHVEPAAGFPSEHKGTAWRYCRAHVATPRAVPVDGTIDPCPTPGYAGKHTAVGAGAISSPYVCHGCSTFFTLPERDNTPGVSGSGTAALHEGEEHVGRDDQDDDDQDELHPAVLPTDAGANPDRALARVVIHNDEAPKRPPHPCELGAHRWAWLIDGRRACIYCGRP